MLAPSLSRFEFRAPAHIRLQPCTHTVTALHTYGHSPAHIQLQPGYLRLQLGYQRLQPVLHGAAARCPPVGAGALRVPRAFGDDARLLCTYSTN